MPIFAPSHAEILAFMLPSIGDYDILKSDTNALFLATRNFHYEDQSRAISRGVSRVWYIQSVGVQRDSFPRAHLNGIYTNNVGI